MSVQIPLLDKATAKPSKVAVRVEEIVYDKFDVKRFVENFEVLTEATGGVGRLRGFVLDLATRGLLVSQRPADGSAQDLLVKLGRSGSGANGSNAESPPFDLPASWRWTTVGKVCSYIQRGKSPKYVETSPVPVVSQKCVQWEGFLIDRARFIDPASLDAYAEERFLREGDLLWNSTGHGTVGRVAVFRKDDRYSRVVADSHVTVLRPQIDPRFLWCWIASPAVQATIDDLVSGTTKQTELATSTIVSHGLPLPPLAEQKRIVAKVDDLMRLIDDLEAKQAKKRETQTRLRTAALDALTSAEGPEEFEAAWKRVAENFGVLFERAESVSVLRDLVLEMAFTGRLVGRVNGDDDSEDLVRDIDAAWQGRKRKEGLPQVEADEIPPSPSRWAWRRLGDLAAIVGGVTKGRDLRGRTVQRYPYLRVANVQRGFLDLGVMKEIEIPAEELSKYRLESGDVLFTEGGDWDKLGRSSVWRGELDPCIHQNHVFRARLVFEGLDPAWVSLFANSPLGRRYFENAAKQTTNLASINMTQLRHCPIPIPPLAEKKRIVAKVEHLMKLCDDLEAKLQRAEDTAAKLVEAVVSEMAA